MNDLIEKLSNLRSQFNCFDENERDAYNTLSEAIKVLSEQPEPCEDAVSRKELLKFFSNNGEGSWTYDTVAIGYIKALPSVIPKRKKGKWKPISDGYLDIYECDQCSETEDYERNYCPNCGADMRGEQDG